MFFIMTANPKLIAERYNIFDESTLSQRINRRTLNNMKKNAAISISPLCLSAYPDNANRKADNNPAFFSLNISNDKRYPKKLKGRQKGLRVSLRLIGLIRRIICNRHQLNKNKEATVRQFPIFLQRLC